MTTDIAPQERMLNYAFLLGGLTALIFGIILLIRQEEALALIMVLLGLWWLVHGAFLLFTVFMDSTDAGWKVVIGILGIVAGILALMNPAEAADAMRGAIGIIIGILGIIIGLTALLGAFRGGGLGAAVFGVVSLGLGVLILTRPGSSTTLLITLFAILLVVDGIAGIYLAFRYR